MSPGFVHAIAVALTVTLAIDAGTGRCRPGPAVNKRGFRPLDVITYAVAPSVDGRPFPSWLVPCVRHAFDAWSQANARSGLGVRFAPGDGGIVVRMDKQDGLLLPPGRAGAWSDGTRAADGYLEGAAIWLSADPVVLDSCDGVTKIVLHELGHLHGLADNPRFRGQSVMNPAARRNDLGGYIPYAPTRCDAERARLASDGANARAVRPR